MATRTWLGGTSTDFYTAANWMTGVPVPGDTLVVAGGTVDMSGSRSLTLGSTYIFNFETIDFGAASAATPAELDLSHNAILGTGMAIVMSGAAAYGSIVAKGNAGIDDKITLNATTGGLTLNGTAGTLTQLHKGSITVSSAATLTLLGNVTDEGSIILANAAGATLVNNATLNVNGGTLGVYGGDTLAGTGTIQLGLGALVDLHSAVGSGQTLNFTQPAATLALHSPGTFQGVVQNFGTGDLIDFASLGSITSATLANNTLTAYAGAVAVATLNNFGGAAGLLSVKSDGGSGTLVGYAGASSQALYLANAAAKALGANTVQATMTTPGGTKINGAGVKIGIISTGFNVYGDANANAQAGLLPLNTSTNTSAVNVLIEGSPTGSEEGQAMAQLIYQIAPGATLYFASGSGDYAAAVAALQAQGVQIIADDLSQTDNPTFQIAGVNDTAVQSAVSSGINYFLSAGNFNNAYLAEAFTPTTTTLTGIGAAKAEIFSNGTPYEQMIAFGNVTGQLLLNWTAPWPTTADTPEQLQFAVYDGSGNLLGTSTQSTAVAQNGSTYAIPQETFNVGQLDFTTDTNISVAIWQTGTTTPAYFELSFTNGGSAGPGGGAAETTTIADGTGPGGAILDTSAGVGTGMLNGAKLIPGVNTVGAAAYKDTSTYGTPGYMEEFSDTGTGILYYDSSGNPISGGQVLSKVDFTSLDSVTLNVANFSEPFDGTSAATPDAAAIAALMLQANPSLTSAQITSILTSTATSLGLPTAQQGAGLVSATAAVSAALALACFAEGTRLETAQGPVAVESLRVGDLLRTASGGLRPIVWIGHRAVACLTDPDPRAVWPVRVRADAFGPGLPLRDLWLSPEHALLVDGALIPVRELVDGDAIASVAVDRIVYWHVELDAHDAVLAENLPAESFLANDRNRDDFETSALLEMRAPAAPFAPLRRQGMVVERARAALRRSRVCA